MLGGLRGSQLCSPPADALLAELEQSSRPASTDYTLLAPSSAQRDTAPTRPLANCSQKKHAPAPPEVTLWGLDKWAKAPKILLSSRWGCPRGAEGQWGASCGLSCRDVSSQVKLPPRAQPPRKDLETVYR